MRWMLVAVLWFVVVPVARADTTIGFDDQPAGTAISSQYAGVAFDSFKPVVRTPPAGQAQSGANVADIDTCGSCEFPPPATTATFTTPTSAVSVYVGVLGEGSAQVTLTAYNSSHAAIATTSATAGVGVHTRLSVAASGIVSVRVSASGNDNGKQVAIDDFTYATPTAPPAPDFSLTAQDASVEVEQGATATDPLTIGRFGGSTGPIDLTADAPPGVHASFDPNPAPGTASTLTISADAGAPLTTAPITITATPESASAGTGTRTATIQVTVTPACVVVRTYAQLDGALDSGRKCVYVADDAEIDVSPGVTVPDGGTLMSGRSATTLGGLLYASHATPFTNAITLRNHTHVTGLRIRGDDRAAVKGADSDDQFDGILIANADDTHPVTDALVDNNEIYDWPNAAVGIGPVTNALATADHIRVTGNFIHNNVECAPGGGYGVVTGGDGIVTIDHNVFNYNRHDVAGDGSPGSGYVATRNLSLSDQYPCADGTYNQHYDMHGTGPGHKGGAAGLYIAIEHNAIRGAQHYAGNTRLAFDLRGTPVQRAFFNHNTVTASGEGDALKVHGVDQDDLESSGHLSITGNHYDVDTSRDLAVGDFDGDGHADVFQPTGSQWVYAPQGRYAWRMLHDSDLGLSRLAFGDFDGDGKTDVFSQSGSKWRVSYGAATTWQDLPAGSSIPMRYYRFGDFDGDGRTDVFRANGKHFILSSGGATAWKDIGTSGYKVGDLRFGDFDGDGKTDVFSLADDHWSVSYAGTSEWRRLNRQLSDDLGHLRFADFDGDGRTDVARSHDGDWQVSWGGRSRWHLLNAGAGGFAHTLLGDFDADRHVDVLNYRDAASYRLSRSAAAVFSGWSRQKMF